MYELTRQFRNIIRKNDLNKMGIQNLILELNSHLEKNIRVALSDTKYYLVNSSIEINLREENK